MTTENGVARTLDTIVTSSRILLEESEFDGSIGIHGEQIVGLYPRGHVLPEAKRVIDAGKKVVIPGLIDSHVHLRDPGFTHKETVAHGTRAAAVGGVTTVIDMPNVNPPTSTLESFQEHIENARPQAHVDFGHNAAGTNPSEIADLARAGATAFKIFMMRDVGRDYPHMPGTMVEDHGLLYELFSEIGRTGRVVMVHPHDQSLWEKFVDDAWRNEGRTPQSYARAWSRDDGLIFNSGTAFAIELQRATGVPLHLLHTVSERMIALVEWAREQGQDVTCELNPHCVFLGSSWNNIERLGPYALGVWIPDRHVTALWDAARRGVIDIIGTDHAPHTREEKEQGWEDMFAAPGGSPALQEYLSLFLTEVNTGHIDLRRVVEMASTNPAKRFGLYPFKGAIRIGADADLVIVDLERETAIDETRVQSKIGYTPYAGRVIRGAPVMTLVRGTVVAEEGEVLVEPGFGRFVGERLAQRDA